MLEILGRSSSINVRKVLWTCAELGVDYRHTEWGAGDLSLRDPAFQALNPNALVPVIRDGDFVLWESNTICRYLAAKAGRADLLPAEPAARAMVEQWMDWQATELNTAWRHAFMGLVRKSPAFADPAQIAASVPICLPCGTTTTGSPSGRAFERTAATACPDTPQRAPAGRMPRPARAQP